MANKNIHPEVFRYVNQHSGNSWDTIKVQEKSFNLMTEHHDRMVPEQGAVCKGFLCPACASEHIELIDTWGTGSLAGVHEYKEFHCLDCHAYSLYERETG